MRTAPVIYSINGIYKKARKTSLRVCTFYYC